MSLAWCLQHESFQIRKRAGVGGGERELHKGVLLRTEGCVSNSAFQGRRGKVRRR